MIEIVLITLSFLLSIWLGYSIVKVLLAEYRRKILQRLNDINKTHEDTMRDLEYSYEVWIDQLYEENECSHYDFD